MASSSADYPYFDTISYRYGPWIGGSAFAMFLYGVTCAQTMYYFWHYSRDQLWMKSLVAVLWALDTVIGVFDVMILYFVFIYCNSESMQWAAYYEVGFNMMSVSFWAEFILTSIVVVIVHSYYVYAIWTTSARTWYRRPLSLVLLLLTIGSLVAGLINATFAIHDGVGTIPGYGIPNPNTYNPNSGTIPPITQMVLASITDIGITITICLSTLRQKHSTFQADPILMKLTQYLVERGVLTAAIQLLQMATYIYAQFGDTTYEFGYIIRGFVCPYLWIAFQFVGSKIYVNSFLALLNARNHLRESGEVPELQLRQMKINTYSPADSSLGAHADHQAQANSEYGRCGDVHSLRLAAGLACLLSDGDLSESVTTIA